MEKPWVALAREGQTYDIPYGFVYVGQGSLKGEGFRTGTMMSSFHKKGRWPTSVDGTTGSSSIWYYAVQRDEWERVTGYKYDQVFKKKALKPIKRKKATKKVTAKKEKTLKEIKAELEEARKLIDKKIHSETSPDDINTVYRVVLFVDKTDPSYPRLGGSLKDRFFDEHGYVILLCGSGTWAIPYGMHVVLPDPIKVNGYIGVEHEHTWVFGCATISKSTLAAAKDFLSINSKKLDEENRRIEGVQIGDGVFTREILEKMKLD